jgi:hypothetical protein
MKTMEVAVLRIYIPDDQEHLNRVLTAIEDFGPSGEVNIIERRRPFDSSGKRLKTPEKQLMLEFFEETCRAQIFVDALHDDFKPATIAGSFMFLCEGDSSVLKEATPAQDTAQP